jgi:hypothetical protein
MPDERIVSFGTSTSLIRTGIRWARRTHSKVAFTFCNRFCPTGFSVSPIPRAMLSTRPLIAGAPLISITVAESPNLNEIQLGLLQIGLDPKRIAVDDGQDGFSSVSEVSLVDHEVCHVAIYRCINEGAIQVDLRVLTNSPSGPVCNLTAAILIS